MATRRTVERDFSGDGVLGGERVRGCHPVPAGLVAGGQPGVLHPQQRSFLLGRAERVPVGFVEFGAGRLVHPVVGNDLDAIGGVDEHRDITEHQVLQRRVFAWPGRRCRPPEVSTGSSPRRTARLS
ncbi:hypothetical protein [Micromonospora sp. NPDC050200]|uniref:hypothetical protein n=1 Tax=Micromonospora sp. NPDC050200 TaxID=3155664 RepID=UPI0033D2F510